MILLPGWSEELAFLSAGIALLGCLISSYTDIKWGIVPDKLNYALIGTGVILAFLRFSWTQLFFVYALAVLVFLAGLAAYTFGQLGGGDVKLFAAITLLVPYYPSGIASFLPVVSSFSCPLSYPLIISVFFLAAVLAVFFVSLAYLIKLVGDREAIKKFSHKTLKGLVYVIICSPVFVVWAYLNSKMLFVITPLCLGAFLLAFKEDILEQYWAKEKPVEDLDDDDVLALELMDEKVKDKLGLSKRKTLFNVELAELKENAEEERIKKVLVMEGLPKFVPFILVSLVVNLLFQGGFMCWIFSL